MNSYVEPVAIDGTGRKLLAIYVVGSDLEEDDMAASIDLEELLAGYSALPNKGAVEVIVAFGGAAKDGWQGVKFANISQLRADNEFLEFGNETGSDAYLYQADGAHMGDESSLTLFLDYPREGYANFDQRFLTFWDHGNAYKGFGNDRNFNNDSLSMAEIENAFRSSRAGTFDLVGFDVCLMATMEVAKIIEPNAEYILASEDLEPGHGWLWSSVIELYAQEDNISEAGAAMVDNFVLDVHNSDDKGKTLSLLEMSQYDNLVMALDPVLSSLGEKLFHNEEYSNGLVAGSTHARAFGASERQDSQTSIDLIHFAQLLSENLSET